MALITFNEYLHDDWEEGKYWFEAQGINISDEELARIGRPFYEIKLTTLIDTDAGKIEITHINDTALAVAFLL